jgi:hypothetical protein
MSVVSIEPAAGPQVRIGMHAVQAERAALDALATRCRQPGAFGCMDLLSDHGAWRRPVLLTWAEPDGSSLRAAVLMEEFVLGGVPTGIFKGVEYRGWRTVVAPAGERAQYAIRAARVLVERGALRLRLTLPEEELCVARLLAQGEHRHGVRHWQSAEWSVTPRIVQDALPLGPRAEDTMERLQRDLRRKIRAARRKVETALSAEYVPDVRGDLTIEELRWLHRDAIDRVPWERFRSRYEDCSRAAEGVVAGLRAANGEWLSLTGGWRAADRTVIFWQWNSQRHAEFSLGLAMRAYLFEHETVLGQRELRYDGGTNPRLQSSLVPETVEDLCVRSSTGRSLLLSVVERAVHRTAALCHYEVALIQGFAEGDREWRKVA